MPFGADFEVAWAGGPHGAAASVDGTFPTQLVLTAPDLERGEIIPANEDLVLTWDPPQPNATLDIILVGTLVSTDILTCTVADDGSVTIPAAVVARFAYANAALQLNRITHRRTADVTGSPRRIIDVIGRNEYVHRITVQ